MAPGHRPGPEVNLQPPVDAKLAAVLLLVYPADSPQIASADETRLYLPMMKRPPRSGPHSGQISFPGGAHEAEDAGLEQTALRESEEELGIQPADVRVLGRLSRLYVPPSGFLVSPYVGWSDARPNFRPDPREVAAVLEIPLAHLMAPETRQSEERERPGGASTVPFFQFTEPDREHKIWGASAMMMAEFLAIVDGLSESRE